MSLYIVDIHGELEGDYEIIKKYEEPTTKNDLGVDDEERELALMYLEQIKEDYIEGNGYERHPLPEYYAIETAIKSLAMPSVTPQLSVPEVTALAEWTEKLTKASEDAYNKGYADGMKEQEPQTFKWCTDCKEYDQEKHCCHRWSKVIRDTVEEMKQEQEPKSEWEHDHEILKAYADGANEVLDKIYADIQKLRGCSCGCSDGIIDDVEDIIDKYKGESDKA